MENFILTVNIILPLFLVMAVGYLCQRMKLINADTVKKMNSIVFKVFIPVMLVESLLEAEKDFSAGPKIFLFAGIGIVFAYLLMWLVVPLLVKENSKRGVIIQGCCRSNFVLFGVPLVKAMCPDGDYSIAAYLVIIVIPLFSALSVVVLEAYRGEKASFKKILFGIVKNPLIIASVLGIILKFIPVEYPAFFMKALSNLSSISTPLALFLLGAFFEFKKLKDNIKPLIVGICGKLIVLPAIMLPIAAAIGIRGPELASLIIVFGSPSAVTSFTMAQQMGADGELAGQQVVLSSLLSCLSLFVIIFVCKQFALI